MRKVTILLTALTLCFLFSISSASYDPSTFTDISKFLENNSSNGDNPVTDKTAGNTMISTGTNNDNNGGNNRMIIDEKIATDNPSNFFDDDPASSQNAPVVPPAIPEPGTLFLVGLGLLGAGMLVRKK